MFVSLFYYKSLLLTTWAKDFRKHWIFSVLFFLFFGLIDVSFLGANLLKFVTGGWFTVMMATIFASLQFLWRWGRLKMLDQQQIMARNVQDYSFETYENEKAPEKSVSMLLCFSSVSSRIPANFVHFQEMIYPRYKYLIFVTMQAVNVASIELEVKLNKPRELENIYTAVVNYGYADKPPSANEIVLALINLIGVTPPGAEFGLHTDEELLSYVKPVFIIGRDHVVSQPNRWFIHRMLVEAFAILLFFTKSALSFFSLPPDQTLEVGINISI